MLRTKRLATCAFSALFMLLGAVPAVQAQNKPFPEAWFFPDRPANLKAIEGKLMPELKLKTWIGSQVSASDMKGKVVVIDFWATWCGPCVAAIPHNIELVKKFKDKGLVFVGVHDANSGWDGAQSMVNEKKINYSVARDQDGGLSAKAYGLGFWPTYVVIDRKGIVRGAGLMPNQVDHAVEMLLAESAPTAKAESTSEFPAEWFYGGDSRASSMKATEGKPMPTLVATKWNDQPLAPADTKDRVVIVHFLASGNPASMRQAETLAVIEKEMGPQGVVVLGVSPADDSWDTLAKLVEEGKLPSRLCQDAFQAQDPSKEEKKAVSQGAIATAFGVRYFPATIVVDRTGKVRATGVKADKVKEIASKLLAENTSKPAVGEAGK
jgi:thiol-disulfide isomerase/thioredoxin